MTVTTQLDKITEDGSRYDANAMWTAVTNASDFTDHALVAGYLDALQDVEALFIEITQDAYDNYADAGSPTLVAEAVASRCAACKSTDVRWDEMGVYCGQCGEYAE